MRSRTVSWLLALSLLAALVVAGWSTGSQAQPNSAASAAASADAARDGSTDSDAEASDAGTPEPEPPEVPAALAWLRLQHDHLRDLLANKLDTAIEPSSLFDIDITDPELVAIEARRLAAVVERAQRDQEQAEATAADVQADAGVDAGPANARRRKPPAASPKPASSGTKMQDAGPAADAGADHDAGPDDSALRHADPTLWRARIALDRARLDFYRLDVSARSALLHAHAERQHAAASTADKALDVAAQEAAQAEKNKQEALEAARQARTEAERAVHQEYARLLGITKEQAEYETELIQARVAIGKQHDHALVRRREIAEAIALRQQPGQEQDMDADYVMLRQQLQDSRRALASAIDVLAADVSDAPDAGADPLTELPSDIDRASVDKERKLIDQRHTLLSQQEQEVRHERARLLMAEVEMLNRVRLDMLPYLSPTKRGQITGFSSAGLDQAQSELRQVWLTLRYHLFATTSWLQALRDGSGRGTSAWAATWLTLKWLLPVGLFVWWRRRAERLLTALHSWVRASNAKRRRVATPPRWPLSAVNLLRRIRRPLEWLLLFWSVMYLLPATIVGLLEVELIATVCYWTLGGALAINGIDAISSVRASSSGRRPNATQTALVRLRSLRLIGWAVVMFGLILALSNKLVGRGTIYSWVFSTCWFAAIPILLAIVHWWKPVIFERIQRVRKKGAFESWVLAREDGASSFIAAIAGGVALFLSGSLRLLRGWVITFTLVRRLLAYLFRRGMSKKAAEPEAIEYAPIDANVFRLLGPETPSGDIVPSVADKQVQEVIARIKAEGGGVFAIVGERGAGKTTLMERIAKTSDSVTLISCQREDNAALMPLLEAVVYPDGAPHQQADEAARVATHDGALLLDDAQHLISPKMGGLRQLDQVLELARDTSEHCTWIIAIDQAMWRFLDRARGTRPLFDGVINLAPWSEDGIVRLINHRTDVAEVDPSFKHLLTDLPRDADDIDIMEALRRTEASYHRLLWDYASGNPGVALHFWRRSLGIDPAGQLCVRLFNAPDTEDLQGLPDATVFVLRAAVQLGWSNFEQICSVTALPPAQVRDALRYGSMKGFFDRDGERYRVTWNWFRAITRFLKRRHLLFTA